MAMQRWTEQVAGAVASTYDFGKVETVIDIGGGTGALLAGILLAHPHLRGAVFDLPSGVGATDGYLVEHALDRVQIETGSFFETVPSGYDRYVLKSIVHDWDDEHAIDILRTCRAAWAMTLGCCSWSVPPPCARRSRPRRSGSCSVTCR